nr:dihydrodipicolinate synthase family protein [Bacillus litorisediminis]
MGKVTGKIRGFHGIIPPVVTLFNEDGGFHWEANKKLTDYLIDKGVHGILYMGSTGEFSSLSIQQRKTFVSKMVEYVDRRVPVLVGTGTTTLIDTIDLSKHAQASGADGVLIVNPYYWKFSEDQLFEYFSVIADSVEISVILYNIPLLTGQSLSAQLVARLADKKQNIVGIKDTIESLGHIRKLISETKKVRKDFAVFAAFDDLVLPALQMGAAGAINGTSVFAPAYSVNLYNSYREGEYEKALELHQKLLPLMSIYELSQPLFLAIKETVNQAVLGYDTPNIAPAPSIDTALKTNVQSFVNTHLV